MSAYTALHLARLGPQPRRLADAEARIVSELRRTPRLVVLPAEHAVRPLGVGAAVWDVWLQR